MINLETVNWRRDRATLEYIEKKAETLREPESMKPFQLGEAVTYCRSIYNPFAYEIMRRSGHLDKFREAWNEQQRNDIFNRSCRYHGFMLG